MKSFSLLSLVCVGVVGVGHAQTLLKFHVTRTSTLIANTNCSLRLEGVLEGKKVELFRPNVGCDRTLLPGDYELELKKDKILDDGLLSRIYELRLPSGKQFSVILGGMSE